MRCPNQAVRCRLPEKDRAEGPTAEPLGEEKAHLEQKGGCMRKELYLIALTGLFFSISIVGCGSSSSTPTSQTVGAEIIQKYNFHVQGQPTSTGLTLPLQFTDANWELKETTCQQAGYDLTPYAGQDITAIKYNLTETYSGDSLSLVVLAKDQTSICGYIAATNLIPGIIAVNDPNIK